MALTYAPWQLLELRKQLREKADADTIAQRTNLSAEDCAALADMDAVCGAIIAGEPEPREQIGRALSADELAEVLKKESGG